MEKFDSNIEQIFWAPKSEDSILRTIDGTVYTSSDSGSSWKKAQLNGPVSVIVVNPYKRDRYYLFSKEKTFHYQSVDGGKNIILFKTPAPLNTFGSPVLEFHAEEPDWIIFTGNVDCEKTTANCRAVSYYTKDNGKNWKKFAEYVRDCEWGRDAKFKKVEKSLIFCQVFENQSGNMRLKMARNDKTILQKGDNFFQNSQKLLDNVLGFAISENFMVVAVIPQDNHSVLKFVVSVDGNRFSEAQFPPNVNQEAKGFTVLESASGSIFLDISKSTIANQEWGDLFISNYNGTYYSGGLEGTNRSPEGFVDYERMLGLEGVSIMNQVVNRRDISWGGQKKLRTLFSYDDGRSWKPVPAPPKDSTGKKFCEKDSDNCHLHLHGYTERKRIKNEMSDETAVGTMIGIGNVGSKLLSYEQASTFVTNNGGKDWIEAIKGPHLFEFGDHGSVLVFAETSKPINSVSYSFDGGNSIKTMNFSSDKYIYAERFVTDPSGTKQIFNLIGRDSSDSSQKGISVNLDFSSMRDEKCVKNDKDPKNSDFELWSLTNTEGDTCVFGHVSQYYRRKPDRNCYIGEDFSNEVKILKNCECTEADYECDAGFFRNSEGKCDIMPGKTEIWSECVGGSKYQSSGYRKHSLSTCEGGLKLDTPIQYRSCSFIAAAGSSLLTILLVVGIVGLGAAAVIYYYRRSNRYGQIRLPTDGAEESRFTRLKFPGFNDVQDFFKGMFRRAPRYRAGYSRVPIDDSDVIMDDYDEQ